MRKIIIRVVIAAVILLAGIGVFQWHNYQQKVEYRKEALLYFKEEDYSKTISYLGQALKLQSVFAGEPVSPSVLAYFVIISCFISFVIMLQFLLLL